MDQDLEIATVGLGAAALDASAYLVRPVAVGCYPALVLIHEWWGLDAHIEDVARRLAREGYVVLAPDLYFGHVARTPAEAAAHRQALTDETALAVLDGAVDALTAMPSVRPNRIGTIGFCMGGSYALRLAAEEPTIAAVVDFYGRIPFDVLERIECPVLAIYGTADQAIPPSDIERFTLEMARLGKKFDLITYAGAPHAFFNDTRPNYRPEAAADAWRKTLSFLERWLRSS